MELLILGAEPSSIPTAFATGLVLLVSFLVLLFALSYFVWEPVKKVMDDREQLIHDDIQSAENAKRDAEELRKKNEEILSNTQAEISEMFEKSREEAKKQQQSIIDEATINAKRLMSDAEKDIEQEKKKAVREINDQVADLSVLIAQKVIQKELSPQDQKDLIDKYLQEAGDK